MGVDISPDKRQKIFKTQLGMWALCGLNFFKVTGTYAIGYKFNTTTKQHVVFTEVSVKKDGRVQTDSIAVNLDAILSIADEIREGIDFETIIERENTLKTESEKDRSITDTLKLQIGSEQ
ncbi:hypothetical protein ACK8P5_26425 (plasmid) [Paenibacillus sp. EC2-1]|uniref:hypothetical protein n=1 Tax=Paenibacillus sp. EC2-1 TaxID=3388665 RepID=UPI003BEEF337